MTSSKKDLSVSCEHCLEDLSVAPVDSSDSSSASSGSSCSSDTSSDEQEELEEAVEMLSCPGCRMFFYCTGEDFDKVRSYPK